MINENRAVYIYDTDIKLISQYESVNTASQKLDIPKSTLLGYMDKREVNMEKRTVRSKKTWCDKLNQYIIIKSYELIVDRKILGL